MRSPTPFLSLPSPLVRPFLVDLAARYTRGTMDKFDKRYKEKNDAPGGPTRLPNVLMVPEYERYCEVRRTCFLLPTSFSSYLASPFFGRVALRNDR